MDIASSLTHEICARGSRDFKFMIIATGLRSKHANVRPSRGLLKDGDVCRGKIFSSIDDYYASVCRTAAVQKSPGHAERICKIWSDATKRLVELIRPRPSLREIYEAYLRMIAKLELPLICPFAVFEKSYESPKLWLQGLTEIWVSDWPNRC